MALQPNTLAEGHALRLAAEGLGLHADPRFLAMSTMTDDEAVAYFERLERACDAALAALSPGYAAWLATRSE